MQKLAEYLRGWMNYFGISSYYRPIPEIDHWLRRRIRMCCWKQWRRCRTKVRNLLKLGTHLDAAISVGLSRKGPWKLARTYSTQIGMTNQWLKGQGLISVKELWRAVLPHPAQLLVMPSFSLDKISGNILMNDTGYQRLIRDAFLGRDDLHLV